MEISMAKIIKVDEHQACVRRKKMWRREEIELCGAKTHLLGFEQNRWPGVRWLGIHYGPRLRQKRGRLKPCTVAVSIDTRVLEQGRARVGIEKVAVGINLFVNNKRKKREREKQENDSCIL